MSTDLSGQVRRIDYEAGPVGTPVAGDQLVYMDGTTKTLKRADVTAFGGGGGGPKTPWDFEQGASDTIYTVGTVDLENGDSTS